MERTVATSAKATELFGWLLRENVTHEAYLWIQGVINDEKSSVGNRRDRNLLAGYQVWETVHQAIEMDGKEAVQASFEQFLSKHESIETYVTS